MRKINIKNVSGGTISGIPGYNTKATIKVIDNRSIFSVDNSVVKDQNIKIVTDREGNLIDY